MIDTPEQNYASGYEPASAAAPRRRASRADDPLRLRTPRPEPEEHDELDEFDQFEGRNDSPDRDPRFESGTGSSRSLLRLRLRGRLFRFPRTLWGRIAAAAAVLVVLACIAAMAIVVRSFLLHDPHFLLQSSTSIETVGNVHLTRTQLIDVFGEDIERNLFTISLADRRTQLEAIPWVQHATVMRLLPNRLRVSITERTPVAFVRQGSQIGLVDAIGVLLDMPPDAAGDPHYSFPVVTGLSPADPAATRAARMKLYLAFAHDLDSTGQGISQKLSEVDLSNPEDVKALIPEGAVDILVHFGESDFLTRYQRFEQLLPEWRSQYPKLASVDMRYQRQVVLEMQPGASANGDAKPGDASSAGNSTPAAPAPAAAKKPAAHAKPAAKPGKKSKPAHAAPKSTASHTIVTVPKGRAAAAPARPASLTPAAQAGQP